MVEGEVVLQAPDFDEAAVDDDEIDDQREQRPDAGDGIERDAEPARQQRMLAAVALAGERGVGFAAEPEALQVEGDAA